eukprot:TRINITY_DN13264_c0_g1_i2.p1 TRINITY_DN13264_c0_g1~~TRINITY_DN13264_c0_g1_i2.p1  ORF type:complete len:101 (-),score=21.77 TRINITY_DN13264_c0_g1_i2:105-407(-)
MLRSLVGSEMCIRDRYMGAPNVADYLPADHMIIDASQFGSINKLASYLRCVSANKTVADYYRGWRGRVQKDSYASLQDEARRSAVPVSYTHLTLPTKRIV